MASGGSAFSQTLQSQDVTNTGFGEPVIKYGTGGRITNGVRRFDIGGDSTLGYMSNADYGGGFDLSGSYDFGGDNGFGGGSNDAGIVEIVDDRPSIFTPYDDDIPEIIIPDTRPPGEITPFDFGPDDILIPVTYEPDDIPEIIIPAPRPPGPEPVEITPFNFDPAPDDDIPEIIIPAPRPLGPEPVEITPFEFDPAPEPDPFEPVPAPVPVPVPEPELDPVPEPEPAPFDPVPVPFYAPTPIFLPAPAPYYDPTPVAAPTPRQGIYRSQYQNYANPLTMFNASNYGQDVPTSAGYNYASSRQGIDALNQNLRNMADRQMAQTYPDGSPKGADMNQVLAEMRRVGLTATDLENAYYGRTTGLNTPFSVYGKNPPILTPFSFTDVQQPQQMQAPQSVQQKQVTMSNGIFDLIKKLPT